VTDKSVCQGPGPDWRGCTLLARFQTRVQTLDSKLPDDEAEPPAGDVRPKFWKTANLCGACVNRMRFFHDDLRKRNKLYAGSDESHYHGLPTYDSKFIEVGTQHKSPGRRHQFVANGVPQVKVVVEVHEYPETQQRCTRKGCTERSVWHVRSASQSTRACNADLADAVRALGHAAAFEVEVEDAEIEQ